MAILGAGALGIDLGSEQTAICLPGEGVALCEATRILAGAGGPQEVLAAGDDARALAGRVGQEMALVEPVRRGAVADVELAALLMVALSEKATGRKRPFEKGALLAAAPTALTTVERAALSQAMSATGVRKQASLSAPVAAAVGAGLEIARPKGIMMLLLGGGTAEIAVLSMNSVVAARPLRFGSIDLDEAIIHWYWREKGLVIGQRTAEQLKKDIGTALTAGDQGDEEPVLLKGRDAATGGPASIETDGRDICRALEGPVQYLVDSMRHALYNTPPELAADIVEEGIFLSGGGALLYGLAERLSAETGLPTRLSEHAQYDVALGLSAALSDDALYRALSAAGSLTDA